MRPLMLAAELLARRAARTNLLPFVGYTHPSWQSGAHHARICDELEAWRLAYQAHFAYPIEERLARARQPTLLCAPAWDPQLEETREAQRVNPHCEFALLPDAMSDWGPAMLPFLDA